MDYVEITLPVSRAVAERWREPRARAELGALLTLALGSGGDEADLAELLRLRALPAEERAQRLASALAALRASVETAGLTPAEVEDELAAWKRERAADRH